ncbi:MAG: SUMF1/EgtB/PvdO family nonheme iron enzyme [bacterium]
MMNRNDDGNVAKVCVAKGDYLFRAGDEGDCAYLVEEGRLQVLQDLWGAEFVIAEIGPHEIVGEMAILGDQPRMASVRALETTTLATLSRESIHRLLETNPGMAKRLFKVLIRRLAELNGIIIEQLQQKYDLQETGQRELSPAESHQEQPEKTAVQIVNEPEPVSESAGRRTDVSRGRRSSPKSPSPGDEVTLTLTGDIPMTFCFIPEGTFLMGSPEVYEVMCEDEVPQHNVALSESFWLAKFPVTQAQWKAIMRANPSEFKEEDCPVESVSWFDCQKFLKRLGSDQSRGFRLPTEAEWEYACRAGTATRFYWGEDPDEYEVEAYAWYSDNSSREMRPEDAEHSRVMGRRKRTNPVGQKRPNAWGLHDMSGNVWEWCQDRYTLYSDKVQIDPKGPDSGLERALRGGSWFNLPILLRSAKRFKGKPDTHQSIIGFRPIADSL